VRKNRQKALDLILKHEGGFAVRANEPGGAVNMGITLQLLGEHWKKSRRVPGPTIRDLKALSPKEAEAIYCARFIDPIKFDELPAGTDYAWLDFCMNSGTRGAVDTLAKHLHITAPAVLTWLKKKLPMDAIATISAARLAKMKAHKDWPTYGKGWTKRVSEVAETAKEML